MWSVVLLEGVAFPQNNGATAEVQADQLCQVKQRDPDAYEYAFQMNKIAIGHDDGSPQVAIARETMKIAKAKGCIS